MFWFIPKTRQIHPVLHSLRGTMMHRRHTEIQQDRYQHEINWKIIGSILSSIIFVVLLLVTIVGLPIVFTIVNRKPSCSATMYSTDFSNTESLQLCTASASWNRQGITVAGLASGLPSTSLAGLQYPYDIYVYGNGTVLVADSANNRITKWDPGATVGILVAGTDSYGSGSNLLAKPISLAVRVDRLYVSDSENYRIQLFPLNTNFNSPDAMTIIGRYGRGPTLNQINQVASIIIPIRHPSLSYLSDSANHRILQWNLKANVAKVITGISGTFGSDSTSLFNPAGIALNERSNSLYIADRSNNRIQKNNMNGRHSSVTVAGWGQLNTPYAVQLDPSGLNMFIADTMNHRILVWLNEALQGRSIAGNGTAGNSLFQLNTPTQIRFDSNYNLYVADTNNHRIQRFDLISNGCSDEK